ncbi:translocation/assembly module TamB domain-containing protein [Blattabacterium cuenoti]|uniref:translocation/assembly module TamB domain-containing protein n=1 Tax=Blattabacterium cuenoti TaxID=1653831 RepID=UPI00163C326D|nr:translocation/assembly module TamB domain-containing protein [Blattabacterium cuenoti]
MNNIFFYKFQKKRILILILLFLLGFLLFSVYQKQKIKEKVSTFFLKCFLKKVKNHWNEKITIKHASINFLEKEVLFQDLKILDHHHFSFIHISKCKISIDNLLYFIFINSEHLKIKNISIENSSFFIKKYIKEKENNIIFFIKNFLIHKKLNKFHINFITCSKLTINKSYLEYQNTSFNKKKFQHFFSSCITNIKIDNQKIKASIFSFQSKKGFIKKNKFPFIKHLSCDLIYYYSISKLKGNNVFLKTTSSFLKGNFTLFQTQKNKILFPKKNIQCQILEGSKLGSDLGVLFYKKWNSLSKIFIQGSIYGKFNHEKKMFVLYKISITDSKKNKLFANRIHIFYDVKKKWKEIKFFKTFFQFYPYDMKMKDDMKKTILHNLDPKFQFSRLFFNLKEPIIYKGDFLLSSFENKKNLIIKIKGIVQNRFFVVKISSYVYFLNQQYTGEIFIEKKYLLSKKKNNISFLPEKQIPITNTLSNLCILNLKKNFYNVFITLLFSYSDYKIHFIGKKFEPLQRIYVNIYNKNKINRKIKIIFINNNKNQSFQKIRINIHDMIIGHIYGCIKWKNLFKIFCLKNQFNKKETQYVKFNFLIKKSFFDFIEPIKNRNIFSDVQISGEKKYNTFKMIFFTKSIQLNNIFIDQLFITINSSLKEKIKIYIEKIISKNCFSKKINMSIFDYTNFWIINSKFFFKLKKQEYKEQILNFFCKKEGNFITCNPFLSKLNINGNNWMIDYNYPHLGIIKIDLIHQKYIIDNIIFFYEKQKIIVNANCIKNKQKIFQLYLKNVPLKKIIFNKNIDGLANGFFCYKNVYNQIEPNINIVLKNFSIGKKILGNFSIFSLKKNKKNCEINGILRKNSYDILKIFGNIKNESKNYPKLNLDIIIQNLEINNFSFFLKKMNTEVRGTLTGKIQIFGHLNDPHYFGKLKIQKFGIKINSAKTNYEIINPAYINIFSKFCTLSTSYFVDTKYNTTGDINGFFLHKNLIQWDLIKLFINTKKLLVLDSDETKNNFLFGKIFTHGKIQITKKENHTLISMNNGKILNSSHLYIKPKILEYHKKNVSKKKLNDFKKKEGYDSLLIDINTIINKNTKVSILLDKNHFIEFRGEGSLLIEKTFKKNIQTSGRYFIKNGFYHFYKNDKIPIKLEKTFKIKPGGSITWKNDFNQSNINLIAYDTKYVYNITEYIEDFFIKENSKNQKNIILTELRIHISGRIQKPNINMYILFPDSHKNIQKILSEKLNSFEEKTMQFISILILEKFFIKKNFFYFSIYEIILKKLKNILSSYNNPN